jgi:hypothetical protein
VDQLALVPQRDPDCHENLAVWKEDGKWNWVCCCRKCSAVDAEQAAHRLADHRRYLKENVPWARLEAA